MVFLLATHCYRIIFCPELGCSQRPEVSHLLELQLQAVVSHLIWVLRTKLLWKNSAVTAQPSQFYTMARRWQYEARYQPWDGTFLFLQVLCGVDSS